MNRTEFVTCLVIIILLASCSAPNPTATSTSALPSPTPIPFLMNDDTFSGMPQDFLLNEETLAGYVPQDIGFESDNARVIELREDGADYVDATGRLDGWQIQFNREAGQGPSYIVQVVNTFDSPVGPVTAISPVWQPGIYDQFENGGLEQLSGVEGLQGETYLMWRDASGSVGLQIAYRNLLLFYTGPHESEADPLFFAQLARAHMDWIRAREPQSQ